MEQEPATLQATLRYQTRAGRLSRSSTRPFHDRTPGTGLEESRSPIRRKPPRSPAQGAAQPPPALAPFPLYLFDAAPSILL